MALKESGLCIATANNAVPGIAFSEDLHQRSAGFEGGDVTVINCAYGHQEESDKETQSAPKNFRQEHETAQSG
ncbi:MAG: hypothetical protein ACYDDS_06025 [Candidatus Sulfotelmatobacter sp.]